MDVILTSTFMLSKGSGCIGDPRITEAGKLHVWPVLFDERLAEFNQLKEEC
jgi:hypothetical protein